MTYRVLILSNMYPSAEKPYAGVYVKNLYQGLCDSNSGMQYDLLAMPRQYTSKFGSMYKYSRFLLRSFKRFFHKYEVVHIHFFYPLIAWGALYKLFHPSSRLVITCHGTDINNHFSGGVSQRVARKLSRSIDYLITVGEELKQVTEIKLNRKVDAVWPAGIDERVFHNKGECREKHYDFIFVGSFTALKGIPELIAALQTVSKSLRLCFVGSGPLKEDIKALSDKHCLTLKENLPQSEIACLYQRSKFLVLPSKSEAFGLVVSEAMYCGVPAIVSEIGGLTMQVREASNGFFFKSLTAKAIRERLELALDLTSAKYEQLVGEASDSNKQFSLVKIVKQHRQLYRRFFECD